MIAGAGSTQDGIRLPLQQPLCSCGTGRVRWRKHNLSRPGEGQAGGCFFCYDLALRETYKRILQFSKELKSRVMEALGKRTKELQNVFSTQTMLNQKTSNGQTGKFGKRHLKKSLGFCMGRPTFLGVISGSEKPLYSLEKNFI